MNWQEQVRFKMRTAHSEMAELRRWIADKGLSEAESEHLFRGHFKTLDKLALEKMPLAVALDSSDLVVRYQGRLVQGGFCPITKMNRIFSTLREQIVSMAKSHGQLSGKNLRWTGDVDLLVTACTPNLTFGFKMPPEGVTTRSDEGPMLLDPHYTALRDSLAMMGVVTSSLREDNPRAMIDEFTSKHGANMDEAFVDAGLVAARKLIPLRESRIDTVEIAGRSVQSNHTLTLDRDGWEKANRVLQEKRIPRDTLDITGYLVSVDYDVKRFTLKRIDESWNVRALRCSYQDDQEEFVRSFGNKKVHVKGRAYFNLARQPRFMVVEDISKP